MILCSACLLGIQCRFDGTGKAHAGVINLLKSETLIPVCPEQLGGLSTPRDRTERIGTLVRTKNGDDVTEQFSRGAGEVLRIARIFSAEKVIMKQRSPSCGFGEIYDGTFTKKVIKGNGVTSELLANNGIKVITENEL